jgi:molecular chaperone HscA
MSLLQINDPSAGPRPIGIDLGTTNSLVAYVSSLGDPIAISDCDGVVLVPSVVHYRGDRSLVGAVDHAAVLFHQPGNVVRFLSK